MRKHVEKMRRGAENTALAVVFLPKAGRKLSKTVENCRKLRRRSAPDSPPTSLPSP